jgi:hypothetical protein
LELERSMDETKRTIDSVPAVRPLPALSKAVQGHLGRKLKATYDELLRQPVPDRIRQLLEDLDRQESAK